MEQKDTYKVRITSPVLIAPIGQERVHAKAGDEMTLPADDVFNLVAANACVLLDGAQLPNNLKQSARR